MADFPLPLPIKAVAQRKPLRWAFLVGAGVALALGFLPNSLSALTRALTAWDCGIVTYLVTLVILIRGATPALMSERAQEFDEGRYFVLAVSMAAVIASIAVIVLELSAANSAHGAMKNLRVGFVFLTVALSWLFVHASFASHYAHEYYGPANAPVTIRGGLEFPGGEKPDYWDFWHFALVIGVANQTADINITGKTIRHIVTLHGIAAFLFNTVILALTINLAASLFG